MGWVVSATPRPLYPRKKGTVPVVQGIRSPDLQTITGRYIDSANSDHSLRVTGTQKRIV